MAKGDMYLVESSPCFERVLNKMADLLQDLGQALLPTKKEARNLASSRPEVRELVNMLALLASRQNDGEAARGKETEAKGSLDPIEAFVPKDPPLCSSQFTMSGGHSEDSNEKEEKPNCKAELVDELEKVAIEETTIIKAEFGDELEVAEEKCKEEDEATSVVAEKNSSEVCPHCSQSEASLMAACSVRVDERLARELKEVKVACLAQFRELLVEKEGEHMAAMAKLQEEVAEAQRQQSLESEGRAELRGKLKGLRAKLCAQCKKINT